MIITPRRNLYLPERKWGRPQFQRGIICATATYGVAAVAPIYDLANLATSYTDTAAPTQTYGVLMTFQTDATIDVFRDVAANLLDEQDPYTHNVSACWVRCLFVSGNDIISGPTLGSWHLCTVQRQWTYRHTTGGGPDTRAGTYSWTLSSDSSGSPIEEGPKNILLTVGELF